MFTWPEIILLLLRLANAIMGKVNQDQWIRAGYDKAIAEETQAILGKTGAGKAIMEKVNAMSEADIDRELGELH